MTQKNFPANTYLNRDQPMASFWDLLPASWPGQSLDPYLPFAAVPPAGGSKRAAPGVASAVPFGGSSIADDQAQSLPPTFGDLPPSTQLEQSFAPIMPTPAQRGPDPWLVAGPPAGGSKAASSVVGPMGPGDGDANVPTRPLPMTFWALRPPTPHGQPFVPVVPTSDQLDRYAEPLVKSRPVTPGATQFSTGTDHGVLGFVPPVLAPVAGEATEAAAAGRLLALLPTVPLSAAMLLAMTEPMGDSTRKFSQSDDPEYRPQYVLRGGLSKPENLRVDELSTYGLPGQYGISSASAPNMTVDEIARRAQFRNGQMTYTTKRDINHLGYPVEPTGQQTYLHHSIMLPPGTNKLTDARRQALSALFRQHILSNPYRPLSR